LPSGGNSKGGLSYGNIFGWANNAQGQLGNNTVVNQGVPVRIGTDSNWTSLSINGSSAGIRNGQLYAWGNGLTGAIGNNAVLNVSSPVLINSSTDWAKVFTGPYTGTAQLFAIKSDTTMWGCGNNNFGGMGTGNTVDTSSLVQISGTGWDKINLANGSSFAIKTDGTLWITGYNNFGQLGNGTSASRNTWQQVGTESNWVQVSCNSNTTVARKSDNTAWVWGNDTNGALGLNTNGIHRSSPTQLGQANWANVTAFATGGAGVTLDGRLWVWGIGSTGQMGNGTAITYSSPVQTLIADNGWINVVAGQAHLIAERYIIPPATGTPTPSPSFTLSPTPSPSESPTPSPSPSDSPSPTPSESPTPTPSGSPSPTPSPSPSESPSPTPSPSATLTPFFQVYGWGNGGGGQFGNNTVDTYSVPTFIRNDSENSLITASQSTFGQVRTDGTLWGWGAGAFGQLNNSVNISRSSPTQIGSANDWYSFLSTSTAGALKTDGTLWMFGGATNGALGDGQSAASRNSPVQLGEANWTAFSTGSSNQYCCGIKTDGTFWAWGQNSNACYGNGTVVNSSSPVQVDTNTDWLGAQISSSVSSNYVRKADGTIWATGINTNGCLGINVSQSRSSWTQIGSDTDWAAISANGNNTYGLKINGTLWSWGTNTSGQLGHNDLTNRSSPTLVGTSSDWAQIYGGNQYFYGIKKDGSLWVCGLNTGGQLGTGNLINYSSLVQTTIADKNWLSIAAGTNATVAYRNNVAFMTVTPSPEPTMTPTPTPYPTSTIPPLERKALWGVGLNSFGQMGNNNIVSRSTPTQINIDNYTILPNGSVTTGYVKSDGTLWAWGQNQTYGMVGDGTVINRSSPIQIGTENTWSMVAYGSSTAAVKTDGTLWAWGKNLAGSLGLSNVVSMSSPVQVGSDTDWAYCATQIFSGSNGAMFAIKKDGTMWACGQGSNGQLGAGNVNSYSSLVQCLPSNVVYKTVYTGNLCTFAIDADGYLYSTGLNTSGLLGLGDAVNRNTFTKIGTSNAWTDFNGYSPIALKGDGTLWTWGANASGQLGDGTVVNQSSPIQIGTDKTWIKIASTGSSCAAMTNTGQIWVWGAGGSGQLGQNSTVSFSSMVQTTLADNQWIDVHGLQDTFLMFRNAPSPSPTPSPTPTPAPTFAPAPFANYDLYVDGYNSFGQFGNNTAISKSSPIYVSTGTYKSPPSGYLTYSTVTSDNRLLIWGYNNFGTIGDGTIVYKSSPIQIGGAVWSNVNTGIATLGVKTDGTLWAWGVNTAGALGQNDTVNRSSPTQIGSDTDWANCFISGYNGSNGTAFAIKKNGTLYGWGEGNNGQLGTNTVINYSSPVLVSSETTWQKIQPGYQHTMAFKSDGTVWAVGTNASGQLGTSNTTNRSSWVQVGNSNQYLDISLTWHPTIALKGDGSIWTWGLGTSGGLGNNTVANISSPIQIGSDKSWSKINAGRLACAAVDSTGRLWVWGNNSYGSLGTNTPLINYSSMVQTTLSDTNWFDAKLNNLVLMGLRLPPPSATPSPTPSPTASPTPTPSPTIQSFYIWGSNQGGQAGNNDTTNFTTSTLWRSGANYKRIGYGDSVIAVIKNDDTLWLAGSQASNVPSLGNNTGDSYSSFVQTSVGGTWKFVAPGSTTTAIKLDGTLWSWGGNYFGQVGNGNSNLGAQVYTPVQIDSNTNWVSLANMYYGGAAINSLGQLYFWGSDFGVGWSGGGVGLTPTQGPTNKSWSQVAMSTYGTTIALATDGTIWTWGQNSYGNCGRNSATGPNFPVGQVGTGTDWSKVAIGFAHCLALKNNGSLWTWGFNSYGELAQNDTISRSSPTQIPGTWLDVVGGPNATWAIKSDGTVWACGGNGYSQQPFTGNKSSLVQVGSITTYTSFPNIGSTANGCIVKG